jgi:hypothetical protein
MAAARESNLPNVGKDIIRVTIDHADGKRHVVVMGDILKEEARKQAILIAAILEAEGIKWTEKIEE